MHQSPSAAYFSVARQQRLPSTPVQLRHSTTAEESVPIINGSFLLRTPSLRTSFSGLHRSGLLSPTLRRSTTSAFFNSLAPQGLQPAPSHGRRAALNFCASTSGFGFQWIGIDQHAMRHWSAVRFDKRLQVQRIGVDRRGSACDATADAGRRGGLDKAPGC